MVGYVPMVRIDVDAIQFGTSHLQLNQHILCCFLASIAYSNLSINCELRVVGIGNSLYLVVGNVYQRTYPQLNAAEDATQTPHVLTLQIGTVAPTIDLNGNLVLACPFFESISFVTSTNVTYDPTGLRFS